MTATIHHQFSLLFIIFIYYGTGDEIRCIQCYLLVVEKLCIRSLGYVVKCQLILTVFMILCQTIQAVKSMPVKQLQNLLCILKGSANINPHPNFLNFLKKKRKVQKGRKRTNCVCQLNNAVRRDFEIPNCSCSLCLENLKL